MRNDNRKGFDMTLHLYAQSCEHDEAYIVGTRDDLMSLRDTIDRALANKQSGKSSDDIEKFFTADGEGYDVYVKVIPESVETELQLPYAESIGRGLGRNEWEPMLVPTE
jgi:hypothetical protein